MCRGVLCQGDIEGSTIDIKSSDVVVTGTVSTTGNGYGENEGPGAGDIPMATPEDCPANAETISGAGKASRARTHVETMPHPLLEHTHATMPLQLQVARMEATAQTLLTTACCAPHQCLVTSTPPPLAPRAHTAPFARVHTCIIPN